jgi:hypothetical protein
MAASSSHPNNAFDTSALYAALHSFGVPQHLPSTNDRYFDTDATSHMSSSPGNLLPSTL